ncbi:alpha/beta fold hydrolase [Acanthopleuribacter pedis]|uniref:Alpha/beta fold hydrolase n=1 Tax=Acanthopleuribacter pedis TaxID=442870 RepID=A0A8J7U6C5_9BACT|nr:alpha/beta fold hydrolase [Acanthopleuribacter pedis]MBO1320226.1 alpha/beta fold hydrolase [Acanthopleuribacter pedis]
MTADRLTFLHGLESSPDGFRANYLRARFPEIQVPALSKDPWQRHQFLLETLVEPTFLVGSSLGGLSALLLARDIPERVRGMVLLAPAVGFHDAAYRTPEILRLVKALVIPAGKPTTVIMGRNDEVIPFAAVEALVARSPQPDQITFVAVDDQHRLHSEAALAAMVQGIQQVSGLVAATPN